MRTSLEYAGYTSDVPIDAANRDALDLACKAAAKYEFEKYAKANPQVEFNEPEITVMEDVIHRHVRGEWHAVGWI